MKKDVGIRSSHRGGKEGEGQGEQKMAMKMLNMPFWAYCVQIFTTSLEFSVEALRLAASSSLIFFLMYWTAR